jgi:capsular polysaccharide biosynthesis protein
MRRRTPRRMRLFAVLLIAVLTVAGGAGGWLAGRMQGPQYQATTQVLVQFWSINSFLLTGQGDTVGSSDVADAAALATSTDVLDAAARRLDDGRTGAELAGDVTATPGVTSHAVSIVATATTAADARTASAEVAAAMIESLDQRISDTAEGVAGTGDSTFAALVQQRAQVLTSSVKPLQALATGEPQQTAPTMKTPVALAMVGLAAAVLILVALTFARPVVGRAREVQRLVELPAVPFAEPLGGAEASGLVRRLFDTRTTGSIVVVPVDAAAEKSARAFAEWMRARTRDAAEAARIVSTPDPAGTVLAPRPAGDALGAVVLVAPRGTPRRALTDAVALLSTWRSADAVVVPA